MFSYQRKKPKASLKIAPLLDMIFILLIFFVVSTTFSKLPGITINQPEGHTTDKIPPNNLIIGITKTGETIINKRNYSPKKLKETLRIKKSALPNINILIMADKQVELQHVISVMDICKQVQIENIAIAQKLKQE